MSNTVLPPAVFARQAVKKLRAQADPERAHQVQKYFKETVRSFGVPCPKVREIASELFNSIENTWNVDQAVQMCAIRFPKPELETKGVADLILALQKGFSAHAMRPGQAMAGQGLPGQLGLGGHLRRLLHPLGRLHLLDHEAPGADDHELTGISK
ncbi:MAG: DNA alkylation repair protein, partial [Desulfobacterales bacterium]|nr:DNA alkylation repair protein [Desulfobacterales bacterium]